MTIQRKQYVMFVAIAFWLTAGSALAQATPMSDAPGPELCRTTAPSFAEITDIMATPQPTASPTASPVPAGTPASEADITAVTGVVRELIACFNAGEPLRAYGLYTDDYLRHLLSVQGVQNRAGYNLWAIPEPLHPDRYVQILAIRDVKRLDGEEVRALVTLRYADIPVPKTFAFLFLETPNGWRINAFLGEINFSLP